MRGDERPEAPAVTAAAPYAPVSPPTAAAAGGAARKAPHVGLVIAGLMMGILLAALDQTVVGTSIPKIVTSLGGFDRIGWVVSAYLLASTIVIPIAGKLSDLYGRRPVYLVGMVVFLLGSALCGLAASMEQLIAFRAVQGLGGGALFPVALATIADLYPPSERGKIGGIFGGVFGISSVIGPFVGGWIVDNAHLGDVESWRWVFYVNLPVGAVGMTMVALFFPRIDTRHAANIDWPGVVTLTTALVAGLLALVLYDDGHALASPEVLVLLASSVAMLAAFVYAETKAKDPVIPLPLFANPIFRVSVIASLLSGAAMFAIIIYMPTYLQGVLGLSPTYSGTALIPLSMGIVLGSVGSGLLMKRFGYKPFALSGFLIVVGGYLLLWRLSELGAAAPVWRAVAHVAILGLGIGFTIQTFVIAVQNAVERRSIGVTTSALTLARTLGATLGVTILGVLLNNAFVSAARANLAPDWLARFESDPRLGGKLANVYNVLVQPDAAAAIAAAPGGQAAIEGVKTSYAEAMGYLFLAGAAIAAAAFVVALFLKSVPMKSAEEYHGKGAGPVVE